MFKEEKGMHEASKLNKAVKLRKYIYLSKESACPKKGAEDLGSQLVLSMFKLDNSNGDLVRRCLGCDDQELIHL